MVEVAAKTCVAREHGINRHGVSLTAERYR